MNEAKEEFFNKIYGLAESIPKGKVISYGEIARLLGRPNHSRLVGNAMKNAPKDREIPCHRVVNKKGELAPEYVFESKSIQREILISEGVGFDRNGRIKKEFFLDGKVW